MHFVNKLYFESFSVIQKKGNLMHGSNRSSSVPAPAFCLKIEAKPLLNTISALRHRTQKCLHQKDHTKKLAADELV